MYIYIWLPLTIFFIIITTSAIKVSEFANHPSFLTKVKSAETLNLTKTIEK